MRADAAGAGDRLGFGVDRLLWDPVPGAANYEVWVEGSPGYDQDGYSCGPTRRIAVVPGSQPYLTDPELGLTEEREIMFGSWTNFRYFVKAVDIQGRVSDQPFPVVCRGGCRWESPTLIPLLRLLARSDER